MLVLSLAPTTTRIRILFGRFRNSIGSGRINVSNGSAEHSFSCYTANFSCLASVNKHSRLYHQLVQRIVFFLADSYHRDHLGCNPSCVMFAGALFTSRITASGLLPPNSRQMV